MHCTSVTEQAEPGTMAVKHLACPSHTCLVNILVPLQTTKTRGYTGIKESTGFLPRREEAARESRWRTDTTVPGQTRIAKPAETPRSWGTASSLFHTCTHLGAAWGRCDRVAQSLEDVPFKTETPRAVAVKLGSWAQRRGRQIGDAAARNEPKEAMGKEQPGLSGMEIVLLHTCTEKANRAACEAVGKSRLYG